jgi:hypothetical protein
MWPDEPAVARGAVMKTVEEYLRHARECEDLARTARSQEERERIIQMAETWRALARTRRKLKQLKEGTEPPP